MENIVFIIVMEGCAVPVSVFRIPIMEKAANTTRVSFKAGVSRL